MDTEKRGIECLCLSQRCPGPGKTKFNVSGGGAGGQGAAGPGWGRLGGVGAPAPFFFFFFLFRGCKFLERGEGEPGKGDGVAVGGGVERGGKPFNDSLIEPV